MDANSTHILRAALQDQPGTYREIELPSQKNLYALAKAIVGAFGFYFDHAFGFYSRLTGGDFMHSQPAYELFADIGEETDAQSVELTRIAQALPTIGHKMLFLFDYGDAWRFTLEVVGFGRKIAKARYPKILKTVGTAPEQYPQLDDEDDP